MRAGAQSSSDKAAALKDLVVSQNFVFKAQTALPQSGPVHQLNYDYTLTVSKAAVICDLPYFGRAFTAIDPSKSPMSFTSKDFDYSATPHKKGGWEIVIKPKDMKEDVQQLYISISADGYANLRVVSTNRDGIQYNGQVVAPKSN